MAMNYSYEPNSHKHHEEQEQKKKNEVVVNGKTSFKENKARKLTSSFISEDARNIKSHLWSDVIVPGILRMVRDGVTNALDMAFNLPSGNRSNVGSNESWRRYNNSSNSSRNSVHVAARYQYKDVIFETRRDAMDTLEEMFHILDRYDSVSVSDYYDITRLPADYTDSKYGWTDLNGSDVIAYGNGTYTIKFPSVKPL